MDFNAFPIKISAGLFVENDKLILNFILKCKSLKKLQNFEKGGILVSYIYVYYKNTIIYSVPLAKT